MPTIKRGGMYVCFKIEPAPGDNSEENLVLINPMAAEHCAVIDIGQIAQLIDNEVRERIVPRHRCQDVIGGSAFFHESSAAIRPYQARMLLYFSQGRRPGCA